MDSAHYLFYFLNFEWWRGKKNGTDTERYFIQWFTPQMPTSAGARPGQSRKTGTQFRFPTQVAGSQILNHQLLFPHGTHQQKAKLEMKLGLSNPVTYGSQHPIPSHTFFKIVLLHELFEVSCFSSEEIQGGRLKS